MENRQRRILYPVFSDWVFSLYLVIREQVTPAAAERQERSDRVSEEASYLLNLHLALTR